MARSIWLETVLLASNEGPQPLTQHGRQSSVLSPLSREYKEGHVDCRHNAISSGYNTRMQAVAPRARGAHPRPWPLIPPPAPPPPPTLQSYTSHSLTTVSQRSLSSGNPSSLDDSMLARAVINYGRRTRFGTWPLDFTSCGSPRATRRHTGPAVKVYKRAGDIDLDGRVVPVGADAWYYAFCHKGHMAFPYPLWGQEVGDRDWLHHQHEQDRRQERRIRRLARGTRRPRSGEKLIFGFKVEYRCLVQERRPDGHNPRGSRTWPQVDVQESP